MNPARRRIDFDALEQLVAAVTDAAPSDTRPRGYENALNALYRHASYVVVHGEAAYLRALIDEQPRPTRRHVRVAAIVATIQAERQLSLTTIAYKIGMPRARLRAIVNRARGEPYDARPAYRRAPSKEALRRLFAVSESIDVHFAPLQGADR